MNKRNLKISLILNAIIVFLTLLSSIIMITGFKFMHGKDIVLNTTKLGVLKFFTVQSNIFMGIMSLIFLFYEIAIIKNKKTEIPLKLYILKLMSTAAVGLTFFVVFAYLGPISKDGIFSLLMNSNLFFHLIIPLLSIITFIFFEKTNSIIFKYTFLGILPPIIYGIYYITNVVYCQEFYKI